jgi:preprotein translocase subunit SecE
MRKVIWPSRADVQTTTSVVLVTVFIFAAYFWLVDNIIGRAIEALLHKLSTHS